MKRLTSGFVLVEIVIALGIVSFAVIVLLGLLSVAIKSNKGAKANTTIAIMSRQVINNLRQQQFASVTNNVTVTTTGPTTLQVAFFDVNGTRLQNAGAPPTDLTRAAALAAGGIYQCTVTAQGDVQTPGLSSPTPTLLNLTLTFTWPIQVPTPPNSFTLHASLADYN